MPKFKKNPSSVMKRSAYKMAYQGNTSAFPFKSPMKDRRTKIVETEVEVKHKHGDEKLGKDSDTGKQSERSPKEI